MIQKVKLPKFLRPYENKNLNRLGNEYDGGYLVDKIKVKESDVLISFGISYDWSFEKDFFKVNKCEIVTFDGSVGLRFFYAKAKNRIKNTLENKNLTYFYKTIWWFILPLRFFSFFNNLNFRKIKKHYELFVYEDTKHINFEYFVEKNGYEPKFIKFKEIMEHQEMQKRIFLKIDIEGEEYSLLESIVKYQNRLVSLVIEFHDLEKENYEILKGFIKKFSLILSHTHINISGGFNHDKTPRVVELTFVNDLNNTIKVSELPHPLDMPTYKTDIKYEISFL